MQQNELLEKADKLIKIADSFKESLTEKSSSKAFRYSGMTSVAKIKKDIEAVQAQGRLLNIGVIGRVKAGKSSLQNSLFFNGQSVLPKAATPMTAALTTMTYGEKFKAVVQLYDKNDLKTIKVLALQYEKIKKQIEDGFRKEEQEKQKRLREGNNDSSAQEKLNKKIKRKVEKELEGRFELRAAFMQQQELDKWTPPPSTDNSLELVADDIYQLKEQLIKYVGVEGEYTSFTKSVDLYLPFNELKQIRVIDTPGVNDPIISREQRTNELLMQCDVVLIVSPAGQYFDTKDQQLVTRLTTREGIQHIYFIASQVDNALNAPEYKGKPLSQSLHKLAKSLITYLEFEIVKMETAKQNSGTVSVLKGKDGTLAERFTPVSAMAGAILEKEKKKQPLEDDEKKALENIKEIFENDYQGNSERCLETLAGLNRVKEFIDQSRQAKMEIIAARQQQVIEQYQKIIVKYHKALIDTVIERRREVNNTDLTALQDNRKGLERVRNKLENAIDGAYQEIYRELERKLNGIDKISLEISTIFDECIEGKLESKGVTETIKGPWYWVDEKKRIQIKTLDSQILSSALKRGIKGSVIKSRIFFDEHIKDFEKGLPKKIFSGCQKVFSDSKGKNIDLDILKKAIRETIENIPTSYDCVESPLPKNLKPAGNLKKVAAECFYNKAVEFIDDYCDEYGNKLKEIRGSIMQCLPEKIANEVYGELDDEIKKVKYDIKNKEQLLFTLDTCEEGLGMVKL